MSIFYEVHILTAEMMRYIHIMTLAGYRTDVLTASERMNLNNPTQGTQCGVKGNATLSVSKRRNFNQMNKEQSYIVLSRFE